MTNKRDTLPASAQQDQDLKKSAGRVKCVLKRPPSAIAERTIAQNGCLIMPFTADLSAGPGGSFAGEVRYSSRATKVRLIVDNRGVTIVMPQIRYREYKLNKDLENIIDKNLEWILKGLMKFELLNDLRKKDVTSGKFPASVPTSIYLAALDETWTVTKIPVLNLKALRAQQPSYERDHHVIFIHSHFGRNESIIALRSWLRIRAQDAFTPLLLQLASEQGLRVEKIFIKDLKSRWGSCSTRNNINLSSRLLFLPPSLVRHVMLHELSHMFEMNHGPAFHARLLAMDPDAEQHSIELSSGWLKVPLWASEPL